MKAPKEKEEGPLRKKDLLSSGSTLLNLALSGKPHGAYPRGKYILFVGDSTSGKTFLGICALAEAAHNPFFKDYRLIYDNVEDGMLMDVDSMFGEKTADRIEPPQTDEDGEPVFSTTIEDFYFNVDDAIKDETPFIYILDSMDGLSSEAEEKKFESDKKAYRKGKEHGGSYGDGKAKKNSSGLRKIVNGLRASGSILIIVAQTRDVLNAMPFQETKTRSGGRALKFYATAEIWTSLGGQIKKSIRGKNRPIGNQVVIKVKKNRITGKLPTIKTAIYPSYGLDDAGSCIDFLLEEKWWKKKGQKIVAGDFGMLSREKIIRAVDGGKMKQLQLEVTKCWKSIEEESQLSRKPRYE